MKQVQYTCDLCKRNSGTFIGLAMSAFSGKEGWHDVAPINADTHLCDKCLGDVARIVDAAAERKATQQERAIAP